MLLRSSANISMRFNLRAGKKAWRETQQRMKIEKIKQNTS